MSDKPFVSPLAIHKEQANLLSLRRPAIPGPTPTGTELSCVVGGIDEEPIPALFHAASRTVYPNRQGN